MSDGASSGVRVGRRTRGVSRPRTRSRPELSSTQTPRDTSRFFSISPAAAAGPAPRTAAVPFPLEVESRERAAASFQLRLWQLAPEPGAAGALAPFG